MLREHWKRALLGLGLTWLAALAMAVIPVGTRGDVDAKLRLVEWLRLNEFGALASIVALGAALFAFLTIGSIRKRLLVRERMPTDIKILQDAITVIQAALSSRRIEAGRILTEIERVDGVLISARSVVTTERARSKLRAAMVKIGEYRSLGRRSWWGLRPRRVDDQVRADALWEVYALIASCIDAMEEEIATLRLLGTLDA